MEVVNKNYAEKIKFNTYDKVLVGVIEAVDFSQGVARFHINYIGKTHEFEFDGLKFFHEMRDAVSSQNDVVMIVLDEENKLSIIKTFTENLNKSELKAIR